MATITIETEALVVPRTSHYSSPSTTRFHVEKAEIANERKDSLMVEGKEITGKGSEFKEYPPHNIPLHQNVLLLFGPKQPYTLQNEWPVPTAQSSNELIVRIQAIGLNPFDWKSADYGFGIPELPYLAGRDFAGVVVKGAGDLKPGDQVIGTSTDYRDMRKAAFQEYAIATRHNVSRLPKNTSIAQGASLGVAYVAAVLALGICLGVDYSRGESSKESLDLWRLVQGLPAGSLPHDVVNECLYGINEHERPKEGDWIAIWGGSSTSALFLSQLAKLAGLQVILVVDLAKHGAKLIERGGNVLVDGKDPARAVEVIRALTNNKLRLAIDTVGKDTATHLVQALATPTADNASRSHIVGLSGLPKIQDAGIVSHTLPIKVFHEVPIVGSTIMTWLEELLEAGLVLPDIALAQGGLGGVNVGLDRMRKGEISGRRLVIPLH